MTQIATKTSITLNHKMNTKYSIRIKCLLVYVIMALGEIEFNEPC